jgi:hypothetical protein
MSEAKSDLSGSAHTELTIGKYKASGLLYMVVGTSIVCQQFSSQGSLIAMALAVFLIPCGIWMVVHADRMMLHLIRAEIQQARQG